MSKIYENAKDNAAFDRCVDVMARLMLKYGNQVLEQRGEKASFWRTLLKKLQFTRCVTIEVLL